jgi:hypothetical protein
MTPEADDQLAREFIEDIRLGHLDKAEAKLDPKVQTPEGKNGLAQLFIMFKQGEVKSTQVVGAYHFSTATPQGTSSTVNLTYELELTTGWFVGFVTIAHGKDGRALITAARFNPASDSQAKSNQFTLANKGAKHFIMLGLCILVPLFMLFVAVLCARSRVRLKWLWIIIILLGFGSLSLNWTTGQFSINQISIRLLGVGFAQRGMAAPWILSVSFPGGAVAFLCLRRKLGGSRVPPPLP